MAPREIFVLVLAMIAANAVVWSGSVVSPVSAAPTSEQQLLAAMSNPKVKTFTLKSDVLLTASLPSLTRHLEVVGKCRGGRRCVVDGQGKYRGFWFEDSFVLKLTNLHFKNMRTPSVDNAATNDSFAEGSGAAAFSYAGVMHLTNCVFENHFAEIGGVIGVRDARVIATDCIFRNNAASGNGGAIKVFSNGGAYIKRSHFIGNTAGGNGGAAHGHEGGLYFADCKFEKNKASSAEGGGGAIYFFYIGGDMSKCQFIGNSAPNGAGGAVGIEDPTLGDIDFCDCTFRDNTAKTPGSENVNSFPSEGTALNDTTDSINFCKTKPAGVRLLPPTIAVVNCTVCSSLESIPS